MVGFSRKRKSSKMRGNREHGRGKKAGRGAGLRGGRGNAGAHKHKRVQYFSKLTDGTYWGREPGFKRPENIVDKPISINVSDIDENVEHWLKAGTAKKEGDAVVIDLGALGFDKLLGSGQATRKYRITVETATDSAKEKVEAAGGSIAAAAATTA
ncbi:MAG: uL15 family ribosomal protein [Thermoplasmatota archaeon]